WRAPPVRRDPAGAFDDRDQRAVVVRLEVGFDDHVDAAEREQPGGIAIGAVAHELGGRGGSGEGGGIGALEHVGAGREHGRGGYAGAGAAMYRAAVMRGFAPRGADPALARD